MRLIAVQGNICANASISYTCLSLMDQMGEGVSRQYWGYSFMKDAVRDYSRNAMPMDVLRLAYKLRVPDKRLLQFLALRVLAQVRPGDFTWMWSTVSLPLVDRLRQRRARVVLECVNTRLGMFRRCLQAAYDDLGWPNPNNWHDGDAAMQEETAIVMRSDLAFAPNPFVRESLLEIGYPENHILDTSYGWCPTRMKGSGVPALPRNGKVRFVFVGWGGVRKGLPHLLRAWRDAAIDAELIIAGIVEKEVEERCADLLALPGVIRTGHVRNIADVYRSCDVFTFPTHEEGGPQVTFEAAGCGLALLVSPMGAAGAFRDGIDAVVASPFAHDQWVEALRRYARDDAYRTAMAGNATLRTQEFTWEQVGRRRLALLKAQPGA